MCKRLSVNAESRSIHPPSPTLTEKPSVAKPGTSSETYERGTWPELERIAEDLPEAGVHFQDTVIYRRAKDAGTATADWFAELIKDDAWFKDVVPNVSALSHRAEAPLTMNTVPGLTQERAA